MDPKVAEPPTALSRARKEPVTKRKPLNPINGTAPPTPLMGLSGFAFRNALRGDLSGLAHHPV